MPVSVVFVCPLPLILRQERTGQRIPRSYIQRETHMTPTVEQLEQAIANALGNPTTGIIADNLHTIAQAAYNTINPTPNDTRVIHTNETRNTP